MSPPRSSHPSANAMAPTEENNHPSPHSREASLRTSLEDRGISPHDAADEPAGRRDNFRRSLSATDVYDLSNLGNVAGGSGPAEISTSSAADHSVSAEYMRKISQQAVMVLDTSRQPEALLPPARGAFLNIDGTTRYEPRATEVASRTAAMDVRPPPTSNGDVPRQQTSSLAPVWKYYQPPQPIAAPGRKTPTPPPAQDAFSPDFQHDPRPTSPRPFKPQHRNVAPGRLLNPMPPPPLFAQKGSWRP